MLNKLSLAIKYLLFVFNLVIFLSGILLLSVGLSIRNVYNHYEQFLTEHYFTVPSLLIIVGLTVLIVTFFGCCGTLKENNCMMITFGFLLTTCFVMEIVGGLAGFVLLEKAHSVITSKLHETMIFYNKTTHITHIWDALQSSCVDSADVNGWSTDPKNQKEFDISPDYKIRPNRTNALNLNGLHCCGAEGLDDWYPILENKLPMSCCGSYDGAIDHQNCTAVEPTVYQQPCYETLSKIVKENASMLSGVAIGIAFLQLLGIALSYSLSKSIRNNYKQI